MPFTARIERAQFYRARSASKEGTWPLPSILLMPRVARARGSSQLPRPFFSILLEEFRFDQVANPACCVA